MDNQEDNTGIVTCLSCMGAKDIFNGVEYIPCNYCKGTGESTRDSNELFMDIEVNKN